MAYMNYSVDDGAKEHVEIENDISVIGRHSEADITIPDEMISRKHIEIIHKEDNFFVVDLGSRNGCFHNNKRITSMRELHDGDLLEMGKTVINFYNPDEPKETLKGYQLNNRISKGGMGTVYKGRQLSLDRIVAIKILHEKLSKRPKFVEQFQAEARAAGMLNHPNIIQVYDCGEEDGRQFFAMEYVDGLTLRQLLNKTGPLPIQEALRIASDVCQGIAFAHQKGILHKDIKPENIMLTRDNQVKIADLGLAESMAAASDETSDRPIVGTPQYMPPEQACGDALDERTDIYAIGGTLYHLICGHSVFPGKKSQTTLIDMQCNTPAPNIKDLMSDQGQIPDRLSKLIMRCLEKKPKNRWNNCDELLAEIEACVADLGDYNPKNSTELKNKNGNRARSSVRTTRSYTKTTKKKSSTLPIAVTIIAILFVMAAAYSYISDKNSKIDTYKGLIKKELIMAKNLHPIEALISHNDFISKNPNHPSINSAKKDINSILTECTEIISSKVNDAMALIEKNELNRAKHIMKSLPEMPDMPIPENIKGIVQDAGLDIVIAESSAVRETPETIEMLNSYLEKNDFTNILKTIDEFKNSHPRTKAAKYLTTFIKSSKQTIIANIDNIIENAQAEPDSKKAIKILQDCLDTQNPPPSSKKLIVREIAKLKGANKFNNLYHSHTTYLKNNDYVSAITALKACAKLKHPKAKTMANEVKELEKRIRKTTEHHISMANAEIKKRNFKKANMIIEKFKANYKIPASCHTMLDSLESSIANQVKVIIAETDNKIAELETKKMYSDALELIRKKEEESKSWGQEYDKSSKKNELRKLAKAHDNLIANMRASLPIHPKFNVKSLKTSISVKGYPIVAVDKEGLTFKKVIEVKTPWSEMSKSFYSFLLLEYKKPRK